MKRTADISTPILLSALTTGFVSHIMTLPWWVSLWCASLLGYLFLSYKTGAPLLSNKMRNFIAIAAFLIILVKSKRSWDNEAGAALLCIMASLKPYEINSHRDRMITIFLSYFMVISSLFFSTTIAMTFYMAVSVILITGFLIRLNHPKKSLSQAVKLAAIMTAQALPLMIIMFLVFPRIHGSLWGIQKKSKGISGFSATLSPGTVGSIVKNNAVAFRVEFSGQKPPYNQLYWRGIVFQVFDGKKWHALQKIPRTKRALPGKDMTNYTVSMESNQSKWIFALDMPVKTPGGTRAQADFTLVTLHPLLKKNLYTLSSFRQYNTGSLEDWETVSLSLPNKGNPKARKLANKLMRESDSPSGYANLVLSMFNREDFHYTLKPGTIKKDSIDGFLFENRKGYCEHYASAFVFLMRAAGIPARIIGGYMGGEENPYGNYMIVRQSDAHAWAEIWIKERGWVRYDPTAAVAPERVEQGMSEALSEDEIPDFLVTGNSVFLTNIFQSIQFGWDSANYHWDTKIIGYTFSRQMQLFKNLGFNLRNSLDRYLVILGIILILTALFTIIYFTIKRTTEKTPDPALKYYLQFIKKMGKAGVEKPGWAGPVMFSEMATHQRPDLSEEINNISKLYTVIRYGGGHDDSATMNLFRNSVKRFKPALSKKKQETRRQ